MTKSRAEVSAEVREYRETRGEDEMTASGFMLLLTLLIAGGIGLAALTASFSYNLTPQLWWLLPYFGVAITGCIMANSQSTPVAFLGYVFIILPTGWIVGPYVKLFQMESVVFAVWITVGVTVALGIMGALWHRSVEHWGGYLMTALLALIIIEGVSILMIWLGYSNLREIFGITDWVAIAIFCTFVFYDMNMAVRMPRNAANAIYSAANMYLNMVNLFVRILARTGTLSVEAAGTVADVGIDI